MKKKTVLALACMMGLAAFGSAAQAEETVSPESYSTVTEACDWGPAVTKVVLKYSGALEQAPEAGEFTAHVKRTYAGTEDPVQAMSYETMSYDVSATAEGDRQIEKVYLSDAQGNEVAEASEYVTLEMVCGPEEGFGDAYGPEMETGLGLNVLLDCNYTITAGETVCDTKEESASVILGVDEFTHDQVYTTETEAIVNDGLDNETIWYASYEPADSEKHPLLIWLHGAGEGGHDTRIPLLGGKATAFVGEEFQSIMNGAYVLAPQTPTVWMNVTGKTYDLSAENAKSMYTDTLMELIQSYVDAHENIDTNRIYIGGCSNGGYMTVNMILNYGDYFAAAFPVCEAYNDEYITDEQIQAVKDLPIWFTHAADDFLVDPKIYSIPTWNRLKEAGAENLHFTLWTNVHDTTGRFTDEDGNPSTYFGHGSWRYVFNNECTVDNDYDGETTTDNKGTGTTIFEWLAEQSK